MNLDIIVEKLSSVPGVMAVTLGGSQSRGEANENSDYDLGLYYRKGELDLKALDESVKSLDDQRRYDLLNSPGEWGPWINGGGWLVVEGVPVDILLRDIDRVEAVIMDCISGVVTIDYQSGHPFGFTNTIYAAETYYTIPLWQHESMPLSHLKELLYSKGLYSPQMRETMLKRFLWEAWFSMLCGRKAAFKGDTNYIMGSVFRTVCSWIEVIYALNNTYLMNEKGSISKINSMDHKPDRFEERVKEIYKMIGEGNFEKAYQKLEELHSEIGKFVNEILPDFH